VQNKVKKSAGGGNGQSLGARRSVRAGLPWQYGVEFVVSRLNQGSALEQ